MGHFVLGQGKCHGSTSHHNPSNSCRLTDNRSLDAWSQRISAETQTSNGGCKTAHEVWLRTCPHCTVWHICSTEMVFGCTFRLGTVSCHVPGFPAVPHLERTTWPLSERMMLHFSTLIKCVNFIVNSNHGHQGLPRPPPLLGTFHPPHACINNICSIVCTDPLELSSGYCARFS